MSDVFIDVALIGLIVAINIALAVVLTAVFTHAWSALKTARKRDKYLIAAICNLTWYCVAVLVLTALDHTVPDSLTVAWFAAWTAELALLAGIKINEKGE